MLKIISIILLLASAALAIERQDTGGLLFRDTYVQGFSPNGSLSTITSTGTTMHDMRNYLAYSFYCPAACYMRQSLTSTKGSYVQVPMASETWHTYVKNAATPFVNISTTSGAAHYWLQQ